MSSEYRKADAELNRVYQQVLKKFAGHDRFLQKLKVAQRAWVAFRDAHLQSLYSEDDKVSKYGSVWPVCWSAHLTELTESRTTQLRRMLEPVQGDACGFRGGTSAEPDQKSPLW